ncbi:MAG: hypothetical protein ACLTK0_05760 [Anaerovoracaceae bacterium]
MLHLSLSYRRFAGCDTVFRVCGKDFVREQIDTGAARKLGSWYEWASKYVFCGLIVIVLVMGTLLGGIG